MEPSTPYLTINLIFSTLIFAIIAKLYILPNFGRWQTTSILIPLLLLEASRHLGLMFLAEGATYPGIPAAFAVTAAWGDFIASLMALGALALVLRKSRVAVPALWIFSIFGTLDFIAAIVLATIHNASVFMGPTWWIPAVWVPAALVAHYVIFALLLNRTTKADLRALSNNT